MCIDSCHNGPNACILCLCRSLATKTCAGCQDVLVLAFTQEVAPPPPPTPGSHPAVRGALKDMRYRTARYPSPEENLTHEVTMTSLRMGF